MSGSNGLSSTPCQRLVEADQAYHDLVRGAGVRALSDENGESLSFSQTNRQELLAYIQRLAPQCPQYQPTALAASATPRRALGFYF